MHLTKAIGKNQIRRRKLTWHSIISDEPHLLKMLQSRLEGVFQIAQVHREDALQVAVCISLVVWDCVPRNTKATGAGKYPSLSHQLKCKEKRLVLLAELRPDKSLPVQVQSPSTRRTSGSTGVSFQRSKVPFVGLQDARIGLTYECVLSCENQTPKNPKRQQAKRCFTSRRKRPCANS